MSGFNLPERYLTLLNLLIGVTILYFLALSVTDAARLHYAPAILPAPSEYPRGAARRFVGRRPRQFYDVIVRRDIFNLAPAPETALPVENEHLDVTLVGTSQVTSGKPYAIIENSGTQAVYRAGDMVPGAGQLLSVARDRVVILHDGHRVALELPRQDLTPGPPLKSARGQPRDFPRAPQSAAQTLGPGIHRLSANRYVLDRATVDRNLKNMAPLFTQIRATPQMANGVASGFLLTEIQPNSIFQQIGLQNGDMLKAINGESVGDPAKALTLLQSLQDQSIITLNVVRDGAPQLIYYRIR